MLSLRKLELIRDSDGPSRVGESISGTVRADLSDGKSLDHVAFWFEVKRPEETRLFEPVRLPAGVEGPGEFEIPFSVDVPQGAFSHESKDVPVELTLVASASESAGLRDDRLELVDASPARGREPVVHERVYEGDGKASPVPALIGGIGTSVFFLYLALTNEFPTEGLLAAAVVGLALGAFVGQTWWEGDDQEAKVALNLKRASFVVSPGEIPSTLTANLELDVPQGARVKSVRLEWIGADGLLKQAKNTYYWDLRPFMEREVVFADDGQLEAGRVHRFTDTIALPDGATPTFIDSVTRVRWYAQVTIEFEDAETQIYVVDIDVEQVDASLAVRPSAPVVARDREAEGSEVVFDSGESSDDEVVTEVATEHASKGG